MNITVSKSAALPVLALASKIATADGKHLNRSLFISTNGKDRLDLSVQSPNAIFSTSIKSVNHAEGNASVSVDLLMNLISNSFDDEVTIDIAEDIWSEKAQAGSFRIYKRIDDVLAPKIDTSSLSFSDVDVQDLTSLIACSLPSVLEKEDRNGSAKFCGALLGGSGDYMSFTATNRHMMTKVQRPMPGVVLPSHVIIHRDNLLAIMGFIQYSDSVGIATQGTCSYGDTLRIVFSNGDSLLSVDTIDEDYPDCSPIFTVKHENHMIAPCRELIRCLRKMTLLSGPSNGAVFRMGGVDDKNLIVSCSGEDGEYMEEIRLLSSEGSPLMMLNPIYAIRVLEIMRTPWVRIGFGDMKDAVSFSECSGSRAKQNENDSAIGRIMRMKMYESSLED